MKSKGWIIGIIFLVIVIGIAAFALFNKNSKVPQSNYSPTLISSNTTISNNDIATNTFENNAKENKPKTETKISSFSTPIVDDTENRINNIKITCSRISNTIVKSKSEFSFCDIVGEPTAEDGYKEAKTIVNGEATDSIGGGNCQVTTTIYNAAKKIDGVKITERHEHGKDVGYIEMGKDATVAYDYLDLKFENNNDFDLKLKAYIKNNKVCVDIYKVA